MNRKDRRSGQDQSKGGGPFAGAPGAPPAALGGNLFAAAVAHFRTGQLEAAERACRDLLRLNPQHADALHLLGMIAFTAGRRDDALDLIRKSLALNVRNADCHVNLAQVLRALGRFDEAADHLRQACALNRSHPAAHLHLADVLMHLGKLDNARAPYERALALDPRMVPALHGLANLALRQGRLAEAVAQFRRVLALAPDFAEACSNLGVALAAQGKADEAAAQYRRALALKPELIDVYRNLGRLMLEAGNVAEALALARRGLALQETEETRGFFVQCVKSLQSLPGDSAVQSDLRNLITRALAEGWSRPGELAALAANLVKAQEPARTCIERAASTWPARVAAHDLFGPGDLRAIADDPLLRALIESAPVLDVALERFLTALRAMLLDMAAKSDASNTIGDEERDFFSALARQCFINEYVFAHTDDELREATRLRDALAASLASSADVCVLWVVAVAAYVPLHTLPQPDALLAKPWPPAVTALLDQQVREPLAERQIRPTLSVLMAIEDEVSLAVQRQYEDMPYPRWIKAAPIGRPTSIDWYLRNQFPHAPLRNIGAKTTLDVLIAGCGTGQHAIETAQRFAGARVLAIDLSRASLGYAVRKTQELGLRQIDYAQADILKLGAIGRSFDLIESVGVLHHLRDPAAGWRVLVSLLRPGGLMHIGLYSARARADVRTARAFIAEHQYGDTADEIRRCRQDILAFDDGTPLRNVARFPDFFTTSECRDLLFHVQEHQFTILQIAAFLRENALTFIGFAGGMTQAYRARFPADAAMTSLDQWDQFEAEAPESFVGMYQFWVQKPAN